MIPAPERELKVVLADLDRTGLFGHVLGELVRAGDILLLNGTLGAGKTTLTQFIARGFGVPEDCYVTSPSFNLLHEYPGRMPLYHIDCYRLDSEEDVEEAGLLDYIGSAAGVAVVEWPDRLGSSMPSSRLEIFLVSESPEKRVATMTFHGEIWRSRIVQVEEKLVASGLLDRRVDKN